MIYQFSLDGTPYNDPLDWEFLSPSYTRLLDRRAATIMQPDGDVSFTGAGFEYLYGIYQGAGMCGEVDLKVEYKTWEGGTFQTIFEGIIFVAEVEFDLERKTATPSVIRDNSYMALINSNSKIPAHVDVGRSKNDETITAASVTTIDFFDPQQSAVSYLYTNRSAFTVYDVLEFLVAFMSDGTLQFDSTYFGSGGDAEGYCLIKGSALRTGTNLPFSIAWDDLMKELFVKFNVAPIIDETTSPPTIRVESSSTTFEQTVSTIVSGDNIRGLKMRSLPFSTGAGTYNGDIPIGQFSTLQIGSTKTEPTGFSFPDIRWKGWQDETYHVTDCPGVKQTLELVGTFVVDSNVIEDVLTTPNSAYDDDIFLVECDLGTGRAVKHDIINPGAIPYTYNDGVSNQSVSGRFVGVVPNSIAALLGDGNDGFQAEKTGTTSSAAGFLALNPVDFDDDSTPPNNDPNGNYNNLTYRYTVPQNGFYAFRTSFKFQNVVPVPSFSPSFDLLITVRRYDSVGTLLQTRTDTQTVSTDSTIIFDPAGFYCNSTDYIDVKIDCSPNGSGPGVISYDLVEAFFLTLAVNNSGGIYQVYDPSTFRGSYYQFQMPMAFEDFLDAVAYPTRFDAWFVNRGGSPDDITGWLVKAAYELGGGIATIELVTTDP